MNADVKHRILEIEAWLSTEKSPRFKPYPKGRHPVAHKARMGALGFRAKDATEGDVQAKKQEMKSELVRLKAQEKADAEKIRIAHNNAGEGPHGDTVVSLPKDRMHAIPKKR